MNWEQINLKAVMEVLSNIEENSIALDGEQSIVYSDGEEELKISYRRIDSPTEQVNSKTPEIVETAPEDTNEEKIKSELHRDLVPQSNEAEVKR